MSANQDGVLGNLPRMQTGQAGSSARTPSTKRVPVLVYVSSDGEDKVSEFPNCTVAVHEGTLTILDSDGPIGWFAHGVWKFAYYADADE